MKSDNAGSIQSMEVEISRPTSTAGNSNSPTSCTTEKYKVRPRWFSPPCLGGVWVWVCPSQQLVDRTNSLNNKERPIVGPNKTNTCSSLPYSSKPTSCRFFHRQSHRRQRQRQNNHSSRSCWQYFQQIQTTLLIFLSIVTISSQQQNDPPPLTIKNIALYKPATQSTTIDQPQYVGMGGPEKAVDGNNSGTSWSDDSISHTALNQPADEIVWWKVDLQESNFIHVIHFYKRMDSCCSSLMVGFQLKVLRQGEIVYAYQHSESTLDPITILTLDPPIIGDEIEIFNAENGIQTEGVTVEITELEVYGTPAVSPLWNVAFGKVATQSATGVNEMGASLAVDGNTSGLFNQGSVTATGGMIDPWWKVALGGLFSISEVRVHGRTGSKADRATGFIMEIFNAGDVVWTYQHAETTPPTIVIIDISPAVWGDEVKIRLDGSGRNLHLAEVGIYAPPLNVAMLPGAIASQSSTGAGGVAQRAIDGNTSGIYVEGSVTHTAYTSDGGTSNPYWKLDLNGEYCIMRVKVWNRAEAAFKILGFVLTINDLNENEIWNSSTDSSVDTLNTAVSYEFPINNGVLGKEVIVTLPGNDKILSLAEVEVFGTSTMCVPSEVPSQLP
eukprot:CAMPEP_0194095938 /NCGR_PEP_ID=MMETSP0149-20130528/57086_1 /TAXON_ID=122233 /ORGANISM="Chaetoceros debilis, Strain MM31A-1" /LENGTH=611 /DNA_ID=CAMNT_0038781899 /DNA_START=196 /DNA_END=2028 /DNA_ORIENTATION=+